LGQKGWEKIMRKPSDSDYDVHVRFFALNAKASAKKPKAEAKQSSSLDSIQQHMKSTPIICRLITFQNTKSVAEILEPKLIRSCTSRLKSKTYKNENGQGLVEYLVIVALMGVAAIAIVRVMGQTVSSRFASVTYALQGVKKSAEAAPIEESHYKKKDLGNFFDGVGGRSN
jgi:Flp pilus assembly pilin Flp